MCLVAPDAMGGQPNLSARPFRLLGDIMNTPEFPLDDATRERLISLYTRKFSAATTTEHKTRYWIQLTELINGRSPEQIAKMEDEIV